MNKQEISKKLTDNHNLFANYIQKLNEKDFLFSNNGKWTTGQQINHIVICVKPIVQVLSMPKSAIEQNFGL